MPNTTEQYRKESERRIRAFRENAAPYPHPAPKPDGKGPKGWRRSMGDGESLSHGKGGWLATMRPDRPGTVMASLVRYFDTRGIAQAVNVYWADKGWRGMVAKAHDGKGNYRLTMSRVFDDADEAMEVCDEVMS